MASVDSMVRHSTIDRVLMAVNGGCHTVEDIRVRCEIGKNLALRCTIILTQERLLKRRGRGVLTSFVPTARGMRASKWLRRGGSRKGPRVEEEGEL